MIEKLDRIPPSQFESFGAWWTWMRYDQVAAILCGHTGPASPGERSSIGCVACRAERECENAQTLEHASHAHPAVDLLVACCD
ncbi:hypothetical protein A3E97_03000 [Candidatus Uhrbacteria bacterium RIFCSPHIGHO2_12_FULL_47_12]|uniref:Uncharacterized protein n=1 Tax=Candidatus Uhrbacteria bacterium RIFCSPLOWO2_02_FULL_48_18 TaxID=1802408 RepID=A0A1F7VAD9_9BACT|nr:MAG: hypothetical protein A2839_00320 [Candidatus Uhrbacteria bacterium RIFCSPHIGHO2_01_FULL_47_10]OGL76175.1 MAG: hypothetical protein A3E97_03000 [Candidatus Uhrbacteria bacterium RIFCSPHIGHO2_12_FULL_47_12]OGL81905.1 MAG: hypothetical protein A3B20_02355 [Candidatus Uhrbacteria bacterium RIFCSPLOWO2_01_FULL_47_17]OGL87068.1 MAG: hypothetical protein A3I41_03945 [Candidatus Uhrbacteria bacterium RIFCSPLOWO2_02_FULL_48_18]OGL92718.1 MAG: hypothetical protein A3H12_03550 [Candidatus Uhrbacte